MTTNICTCGHEEVWHINGRCIHGLVIDYKGIVIDRGCPCGKSSSQEDECAKCGYEESLHGTIYLKECENFIPKGNIVDHILEGESNQSSQTKPLNAVGVHDSSNGNAEALQYREGKDKTADTLRGKTLTDQEVLIELGKYLKRKGWSVFLIEEEGILKGDVGKKNSFRLSFRFVGNKLQETN